MSNGFLGGVQAGYNWRAGVFVVGIEGDYDAANLQGNAPCFLVLNCTIKHSWVADITGRVGVVALDRALIYVKGGFSLGGSQLQCRQHPRRWGYDFYSECERKRNANRRIVRYGR